MKNFMIRFGWSALLIVMLLVVQGCHSRSGGFSD